MQGLALGDAGDRVLDHGARGGPPARKAYERENGQNDTAGGRPKAAHPSFAHAVLPPAHRLHTPHPPDAFGILCVLVVTQCNFHAIDYAIRRLHRTVG